MDQQNQDEKEKAEKDSQQIIPSKKIFQKEPPKQSRRPQPQSPPEPPAQQQQSQTQQPPQQPPEPQQAEQPSHFNVSQIKSELPAQQQATQQQSQPQPPPEPQAQQPEEPEPEKKNNWKIWITVIAVIIIAAGLGFYFLYS